MSKFTSFDEETNASVMREGVRIYNELLNKHGIKSQKSYNMMLNSLCFALICMIKTTIEEENQAQAVDDIHSLLRMLLQEVKTTKDE